MIRVDIMEPSHQGSH